MKVEKNQNPFIFLATYWNLSSKSDDLIISVFEIWQIWGSFCMENPL
jgi:hypothetical protein